MYLPTMGVYSARIQVIPLLSEIIPVCLSRGHEDPDSSGSKDSRDPVASVLHGSECPLSVSPIASSGGESWKI